MSALSVAGQALSRPERVALARAALRQLELAGWSYARSVSPDELADDPDATIGFALIAAQTTRHFAFAPLLPLAGAAVGAVGNFLGKRKAEAEARKAQAEARKAEAEARRGEARIMPAGQSGFSLLPILIVAAGVVLFLLFRR